MLLYVLRILLISILNNRMFTSNEEIILNDTLSAFGDNKANEGNVVQVIQDIIKGLCQEHNYEDQYFWMCKVSYFLLHKIVDDQIIITCPPSHNQVMPWTSFFNIIRRSCLWSSVFKMLFPLCNGHLMELLLRKWREVSTHSHLDSLVLHITMLSSYTEFLSETNDKTQVNCSCNIPEKITDFLGSFTTISLDDLSLDQEKDILLSISVLGRSLEKVSTNNMNALAFHNIYQTLTSDSYVNCSEKQQCFVLEDLLAKQDVLSSRKTLAPGEKETFQKVIISIKSVVALFNDSHKLGLHLMDISQKLEAFIGQFDECNNLSADYDRMTVEKCIYSLKYFLCDYDECTDFLLQQMLLDKLQPAKVTECLECFQQSRECLLRSQHLTGFFSILQQYISKYKSSIDSQIEKQILQQWISMVKDLIVCGFQDMPFESKEKLLRDLLQNSTAGNLCIDYLGGDCLPTAAISETRKKVNLVFNKIVSLSCDDKNVVDKILNVAILSPCLTLRKIVEQITHHREHHELLASVLDKLNILTVLSDSDSNSIFLNTIFGILSENPNESEFGNVKQFFSLILAECSGSWKPVLVQQLFHNFLLPTILPGKSNSSILLSDAVEIFSSIFVNKEVLSFLTFDSMITVAYGFVLVIEDSSDVSDDLLQTIIHNLPDIIQRTANCLHTLEISKRQHATKWAHYICKSLNWRSQLYFRPLFNDSKSCKTILPSCLQSVCDLGGETDNFEFEECYGKGTGLSAWLQCLTVDPTLIPITSLKLNFTSVEDQDMFYNGMTVALCQVLSQCIGEEWKAVTDTLVTLVSEGKLYVPLNCSQPSNVVYHNFKECIVPLSILETLQKVTMLAASSCCSDYMTMFLWCRYTKHHAVNVKNLYQRWTTRKAFDQQLCSFLLSSFFCHACAVIYLLQMSKSLDLTKPCESYFVLALDLLNDFGKVQCNLTEKTETNAKDLLSLREYIQQKAQMLNMVKIITNDHFKNTLELKISNLQ